MSAPSAPPVPELRAALLDWYRAHARALPWRNTRDPYAIWVSEVMLQQTRVDTVIPYWERFLERWPTVQSLARAEDDAVMAAWSGLGYYRRARSMLAAARTIEETHAGTFPRTVEGLRALPGFGAYTAGAVASIAFDAEVPAVDGNVTRVLARIAALEGDVTRGSNARHIQDLAAKLAPGEAPSQLNQALIELGALVCRPRPDCGVCPVSPHCEAHRQGATDRIPAPKVRKAPVEVRMQALIAADETALVLERRPQGAPFAGLFTPLLFEEGMAFPEWAREARKVAQVVHVLTHRRIEAEVWTAPLSEAAEGRRVELEALPTLGLPTFAVKLLEAGLPKLAGLGLLPGRGRQTALPLRFDEDRSR